MMGTGKAGYAASPKHTGSSVQPVMMHDGGVEDQKTLETTKVEGMSSRIIRPAVRALRATPSLRECFRFGGAKPRGYFTPG